METIPDKGVIPSRGTEARSKSIASGSSRGGRNHLPYRVASVTHEQLSKRNTAAGALGPPCRSGLRLQRLRPYTWSFRWARFPPPPACRHVLVANFSSGVCLCGIARQPFKIVRRLLTCRHQPAKQPPLSTRAFALKRPSCVLYYRALYRVVASTGGQGSWTLHGYSGFLSDLASSLADPDVFGDSRAHDRSSGGRSQGGPDPP